MSCKDYNCIHECCDYFGNCPTYSSSCYYYYDKTAVTVGLIIGIVFISVCVLICIIALIICCYRRRRQREHVYGVGPPQTQIAFQSP